MTGGLFAEGGPEGRNTDSRDFEDRLNLMAPDLGYTVLEVNVDTLLGESARSQGLDAIWAYLNPRTGRRDAWLIEAKRHDSARRYTPALMTEETQTLRVKVGRLANQRRRFFEDPDIAKHVDDLRGGLLFHRTPGYDPDKASRALGDIVTARTELGPQPPRVLFGGPDLLNGLAETFDRFGAPRRFWWPPTRRHDGMWSPACPPEQLAAGLVFYENEDGSKILMVRDELTRHDPAAIRTLAWRAGYNLDVVAFTHGTATQRRLMGEAWQREVAVTADLDHGRLPARAEALDLGHETMSAFERRWDPAGDPPQSPPTRPVRHTRRPGRLETAPVTTRRRTREITPYPSPTSVADTFADKATLAGSKRFMAAQGLVVFAHEKDGVSRAAEETWLRPSAYRTMGHMLDLAPVPTVRGFRLLRLNLDQAQLDEHIRGTLLDELVAAAAQTKNEPFTSDRCIRLQDLDRGSGTWPVSLHLAYDHVYDLVGGERVFDRAYVTVHARAVADGEVDIAVLTTRDGDFGAAGAWINAALRLSQRGWLLTPVGLPRTEPTREAGLRAVIDEVGGSRLVGLSSPNQHRDAAVPQASSGFAQIIRDASYNTDFGTLDVILERARQDGVAVGELTAYLRAGGAGVPVVAVRLRQRPRDAHLSLRWHAGKQYTAQDPASVLDRERWETLRPLEWGLDAKEKFILEAWARAGDALRGDDTASQVRHIAS